VSSVETEASDFATAARRVSASILEGVHLRLDLFAVELSEERRRASRLVLTTLALALALFMVFVCLNAALLVVYWETHRIPIVLGMCVFYGALAAVLALVLFRHYRRGDNAFAATRKTLAEDRRVLRERP
jgi:uncharacterized membrane protein YqjE